jgi:hypothetical protein
MIACEYYFRAYSESVIKSVGKNGVLLLGSLLLFGVLTIVLVLTHSYWAGVVLWGCT